MRPPVEASGNAGETRGVNFWTMEADVHRVGCVPVLDGGSVASVSDVSRWYIRGLTAQAVVESLTTK